MGGCFYIVYYMKLTRAAREDSNVKTPIIMIGYPDIARNIKRTGGESLQECR